MYGKGIFQFMVRLVCDIGVFLLLDYVMKILKIQKMFILVILGFFFFLGAHIIHPLVFHFVFFFKGLTFELISFLISSSKF